MRGTIRGTEAFARILSESVINQWDQGMNREGLNNVQTADLVIENDLTDLKFSSLKADNDSLIAVTMERGIGEREEALKRRIGVLRLRLKLKEDSVSITRDEEIKLYNAHSDLAFSLLEYNDYVQAQRLLDTCHAKYEEWGNEQEIPYEYVKYYNGMASIQMLQGHFEKAEYWAKEAAYLAGKMGNNSGVLKWQFLRASIMLQRGKTERARDLHIEVRDARKQRAGVYNELYLESCYAVAVIQESLGKYEDAA
jgi:hypothetical protein